MKKLCVISIVIFLTSTVFGQQTNGGGEGSGAAKSATSADVPRSGKVEVPAEKKVPIVIPKGSAAPVIDGRVDEEIWQTAAVFKDFYQTNPGYNTQPSKPTVVYMMYDELHLYVAFKCWDERDKIRATVAKRDNVFGEDNVRMWLDTYNDRRRAYVLGFNPLGIQQDGIFTEGQGADFSVDIVMESRGVIEDWGWSVEVKIPFRSLRYAAGKGKMWGFNTARNIDRLNDEFNQWLPEDRDVSGFLIQHGKITGLDDVKYERTLEVVPSITISASGNRVQALEVAAGRFVNQPIKKDIGVTLKYTISPNVTLDAAINPDFAEIEADAPVVTANQRFPIFFQEKRPFFLEGADIFQTPVAIYYSRNIVDPDFALKLTGKTGKNSFGLMVASDKAPGNFDENARNLNTQCLLKQFSDSRIQCRDDEFIDKNALFGVFRAKRDFGKENNVGVFLTYRGAPEQKNLLASIDGKYKINSRTTSVFQFVGTNSRRCIQEKDFEPLLDPIQAVLNRDICGTGLFNPPVPPNLPVPLNSTDRSNRTTFDRYRTGNGFAYYANVDYTTDTHGWFAEVGGRSTYYRPDVGFLRRTDNNFAFFYNRFSTKSNPKAKIIRANFGQFTGVDYDFSGNLQAWRGGGNVNFSLQRSIFGFAEAWVGYEKLYEEEFGLKRRPTRAGAFSGDPTRQTWKHGFFTEIGQRFNKHIFYNFYAGYTSNAFDYFVFSPTVAGNNPTPGKSFQGGAYVELTPIDPLRFSANYEKARLVRNGSRIRSFDSDIVSLRSTYQFTRFVFLRARMDYDSLDQRYAGQVLMGWNPSPGKAFYVGYEDNLNRDGFNPFTDNFEPGFVRNGRKFFVRMSYLFSKSF